MDLFSACKPIQESSYPSLCLIVHVPLCLFCLISPHQVVRRLQEKLGLQESKNTFALYEQNALWERPVAGGALIADILTRFEKQMPSSACKTAQTGSPDAIKPSRQTRYQHLV